MVWRGVTAVSTLRNNLSYCECEFQKILYIPQYFSAILSFSKLLPENSTNHADSRNSKNIQGFVNIWIFLKVLESAWFVGFSGKSLPVLAA